MQWAHKAFAQLLNTTDYIIRLHFVPVKMDSVGEGTLEINAFLLSSSDGVKWLMVPTIIGRTASAYERVQCWMRQRTSIGWCYAMLTDGKTVWHWFSNYHKDHVAHIGALLLFFKPKLVSVRSHTATIEKCVKMPNLDTRSSSTQLHQWIEIFRLKSNVRKIA